MAIATAKKTTDTQNIEQNLLATLMSDEAYRPAEPNSLEESGLSLTLVESLICKILLVAGTSSGRSIAERVALPFGILEDLLATLRTRQILVHAGAAPFNDYYYSLTEDGRGRGRTAMKSCSYVGPAPVPLLDYVISVEAQSLNAEAPKRNQLEAAVRGISVHPHLFDSLGPALNSGAGMFLYGAPGNGKSTLAKRITLCFGQEIWVPHAIIEDGQIINLYDPAYHRAVDNKKQSLLKVASHDRRWKKIRRPTVVVGGELTMDNLEIRHDQRSNVSEAPLQMKSNCGCLLIDDFGRQRIEPDQLLNRWIVPLEANHDFLTLPTGKKIQVPFEQLVIFSTNLEPEDLVDEAFLRRIPYKIEIGDPSKEEFHHLFEIYAATYECAYRKEVVDYLLEKHYYPEKRPLRRCHPRDLLNQVRNYCSYNDLKMEMRPEYFDRVAKTLFTVVLGKKQDS